MGETGRETHPRTIFAKVWSCFTILIVAAFGILVSSVISTLRTTIQQVLCQRSHNVRLFAFLEDVKFMTGWRVHLELKK